MKTIERFPLRIDSRTTILVPSSKCNEEYARHYRERMKMNPNIKYGINESKSIDFTSEQIEDIKRLRKSRRTYKEISRKYDVSVTTIRRAIYERND